MMTTLGVALIAATAALFGSWLTSRANLQAIDSNHKYSLERERLQQRSEAIARERDKILNRMERCHLLLSGLSRDFSVTGLTIDWLADLSSVKYDQKYLECCRAADEIRMNFDFYVPSLSDSADDLLGLLNIFWGNFRQVLDFTAKGGAANISAPGQAEAHKAAHDISTTIRTIKKRLLQATHDYLENNAP